MERWLWNVEALERWEREPTTPPPGVAGPVVVAVPAAAPGGAIIPAMAPGVAGPAAAPTIFESATTIDWWTPAKQDAR